MEFLCLTDVIINMRDIVIISPRWESTYSIREQQNKKTFKGTSFYIRGKDSPIHSEVLFKEVLEQMRTVKTIK